MSDDYRELENALTSRDVQKLQPDWKKPPTVADLKHDLMEAMSSHMIHVDEVDRWLSALRGDLKIKTQDGRSKVVPKLVRKQAEWRYAALEEPFLSTDDMFKVAPVTHLDVEPARQNQMILNKQFRVDIPKVKFINEYIRRAVDTGTVVVKLAWEEEIGIVREEQMQPVFAETPEEFMQFGQQLLQAGQIDEPTLMQLIQSGQFTQIPIGEEPVAVDVEKKFVNRPVVEVKDSRLVIIDPSCLGDIDKAQFIVDKFLTDLSSLRKDGRYNEEQLDKIQVRANNDTLDSDFWSPTYSRVQEFHFQDKPRKKLVAYEYWGYWDIHDDGVVVPIVATWVGDVMIRLDENPFPDKKLPFVVVPYLPNCEKVTVYGDADASLIEDNQNIVGAITRGMIDLMGRSANAQQGVRKDFLDPINQARFDKGLDYQFNAVGRLDDAITMAKFPEIPRSAMEMIQLMNGEAEALSGVRSFGMLSPSDPAKASATGIKSASDATARRELGILRRLAAGLVEIGKKIIAMNSVWLDDEEVIRITDEEFVAIKRDDLAGNFDLQLDVSTAEADNAKAQELAFMLQTIGQSVPFDLMKIILIKIAELRKVPDLAFALKQYEPQPDPLAQAKAEAEIKVLEAQAAKDFSAAPKNVADEVLKYAKAEEAGAKGRLTNSEADQKDLDYLNDSSGLNQDRELEKIEIAERFKAMGAIAKEKAKPKPTSTATKK